MNPGDGSMDGWSWTMQGRVTNDESLTQQINYAAVNRGLSYESEGDEPQRAGQLRDRRRSATPRPGRPARPTTAPPRRALPGGTANVLAGDPQPRVDRRAVRHRGRLHLQRRAAAGKTVRNYGFLVNNIGSIGTKAAPVSDPFAAGIVQVAPLDPALAPLHRPLLPRLRPELSRPVALQRVEAGVRPVRRQRQPAQPVAGSHQPRPHGQLRHRARRRQHA